MAAARSSADRVAQSPPNALPRWLWASIAGNRGRGTKVDRHPELLPRPEVLERHVPVAAHNEPYPFSPDNVMPRTKYFWATTKRITIGSRLTRAPAIISGHLPTNWPWKKASPTVVV